MSLILNPAIPFWGAIPGGLKPGNLVLVEGRVAPAAKRFGLNLVVGGSLRGAEEGDIAFHFNARLSEDCVVRNSRLTQHWGPEERKGSAALSLPFQSGRPFKVMILVEEEAYKVAVDGRHFTEYKHRLPYSAVGLFNVEGDVVIDKIEYLKEPCFNSSPVRFTPIPCPSAPDVLQPLYNPPIPLRQPFFGGLRPGMMIYASGRAAVNADRFSINLQKGSNSMDVNTDIAFHFNPRLCERDVVRNTRVGGEWGREERGPTCPFAPGVNFDMIIRVESNRFMVAVNGQHFIEYHHRVLPLHSIDFFSIDGDVVINSIRFQ